MKKIIIAFLLILATIGSVLIILFQFYPVVIVDWRIITAKDFNEVFAASLNYYEQTQKVYPHTITSFGVGVYGGDSQLLQSEEIKNEIKKALLTSLIEDILIDKELRKEVESADLERMVNNKISNIKQGENAEKAAEILYGFSYETFKEKVLSPMAKKEILEGRLYLNNRNIEEYLKIIKAKIRVVILLPGFDWNGKEVIIK